MWSSRAACLQTVWVVASHASRTMLLRSVRGVGFGEEVGDLLGGVLGAGAGKADGGDDGSVAAPQPDEPGLSGGPSSGGGRAGVDLDGDGRHGWSPLSGGVWNGEDAAAGLLGCGQDREGPLRGGRPSSYEVTPSKFERVGEAAGESFAGDHGCGSRLGGQAVPGVKGR